MSEENEDEFDKLLDEFIAKQLSDAEDAELEMNERKESNKPTSVKTLPEDESAKMLFHEERQLYNAYCNFRYAVVEIAKAAEENIPDFLFSAQDLYPRFRPDRIDNLSADIFNSWECLVLSQPIRLSSLPQNPTDEQILSFAEKTTDENLQNALISYVEILIELDGCEIAYNMRKARAKKRKIEKQIYEEHQRHQEKMKKFIEAIQKEKLPIDAERLVNNYFKTSRKDPDGAQKILEENPATYAPIQIEKIPPRFFGMIKAKPEDGIKANKEIGKFLKNLKV